MEIETDHNVDVMIHDPTRPIKLLAIADPVLPVPPEGYGGTERILYQVLKGLSTRGYEITLLGKEGSSIPGQLIPYPDSRGRGKLARGWIKWKFHRLLNSLIPRFDVIHSVCRLDYLLPALRSPIPKHHTFQNPIEPNQIEYLKANVHGRMVLSACGEKMTREHQHYGIWRPIHNAIDIERFLFQPTPTETPYLAFLGRLTANKGVREAIVVARKVGIPLHIAGNISNEPGGKEYFERFVKPEIDGKSVLYLGEMNDEQKIKHLGGASVFLNPIQWEEPFGIVTIESLACGTPVVACPLGELSNVIEEGRTGYLASDVESLAKAVKQAMKLDRRNCRRASEERFSTTAMVDKYDQVFRWLVSGNTTVPSHWHNP